MSDSTGAGSSNDKAGKSSWPNYLTRLAHGSAPFISTFLLIHLSAPVLANLGGSSLASQVMLLGREYYQTPFGHKFLVVVPLLIHSASAVAKRLVAPQRARKLKSIFSLTGYATMLLFLPVHYITHRVNPASPESPIYSVGPAELDFEFVKLGLQQWPGRSWFLYAGLVACVAWHAAEGMQIIWNTWLRGSLGGWKSSLKSRSITAIAVVVPVLSGLFAIWREPLMTLASSATRFEAAFQKSVLFRF